MDRNVTAKDRKLPLVVTVCEQINIYTPTFTHSHCFWPVRSGEQVHTDAKWLPALKSESTCSHLDPHRPLLVLFPQVSKCDSFP